MRTLFRNLSMVLIALLSFAAAPPARVGKVAGTISSKDGPVVGVSVEMLHLDRKVITNEDGNFVFLGILPGADTVRITGAGFGVPVVPIEIETGVTTSVEARQDKDGTTIITHHSMQFPTQAAVRPRPGKTTIAGRVLDAGTQHPSPRDEVEAEFSYRDADGVRWIIHGFSTTTDKKGRYAFNNVDPGAYELSIHRYISGDISRECVLGSVECGRSHVQAVADTMYTVTIFRDQRGIQRQSDGRRNKLNR